MFNQRPAENVLTSCSQITIEVVVVKPFNYDKLILLPIKVSEIEPTASGTTFTVMKNAEPPSQAK